VKKNNKGSWVGVDLDGTLAVHPDWEGFDPYRIGPPVLRMVDRVKAWIAAGIDVRVFTARASDNDPAVVKCIQDWCEKHVGKRLPVTCTKDYQMIELWDDRAVQVIRNTGIAWDRDVLQGLDLDGRIAACKEVMQTSLCDCFNEECEKCPFRGDM
jgi:hypothetical protein